MKLSLLAVLATVVGFLITTVRADDEDTCAKNPTDCVSCPHGSEACYKCSSTNVLLNYACTPKDGLSEYAYFDHRHANGTHIEYSSICPEEDSYVYTISTPMQCIRCPVECDGCYYSPTTGAPKCWDCAPGYYMTNAGPLGTFTFSEIDRYTDSTYLPSCQLKPTATNSQSLSLTVNIKVDALVAQPNLDLAACAGTLNMDSFFRALVFVEQICSSAYTNGQLSFVFEKGNHFIMNDHPTYLSESSDKVFEFFRNSNFEITMKSLQSKSNVTLYWRTENIRFFVFNTLTLNDLTINGSENYKALNGASKQDCFDQRKLCCNSEDSALYTCSNERAVKYFSDNAKQPDLVGQGLITVMSSKRQTKDAMPSIFINRLDVTSMIMQHSQKNRNFVKINSNFAFLQINAVTVDKYYYPGGFVSNYKYMQAKRPTDALDLDMGMIRRQDCKVRLPGLSKLQNCISIYVTSSTFQNYNYLKYVRASNGVTSTSFFVESFTFNLYSAMTGLYISKSKFNRAFVATRFSGSDAITSASILTCASPYVSTSESDLAKSSYIKTDPNLHFDQDQVSQLTQLTGSHITWQYFKGELNVTQSTFDSNISYQSPAISIKYYSDSMGASQKSSYIFSDVDGNFGFVANSVFSLLSSTFSNNFAYVANSVMQFYSHSHSSYANPAKPTCMGIQLNANTFINNLGCPQAYHVVSINCRFDEIPIDDSVATWYEQFNPSGNTQTLYGELMQQVVIKANKFTGNHAIISNAVFVNGAKDLLVKDNTFTSNGVIQANSKVLIEDNASPYTWTEGYSATTYPVMKTTWMTESSALLVQHAVKMFFSANQFVGNWAVSSGDSYFGQCIMAHRILSKTDIKFSDNSFKQHVGIPVAFLEAAEIGLEYATLPLVSMHFYADQNLRQTIKQSIEIDFYQNTFESNSYKINTKNKDLTNPKLDSYTLYSSGGSVQLIKVFTDNEIAGSQPVSSDYIFTIQTSITFLIRNSAFTKNIHYNGGCMMEISGMTQVQTQVNTFTSNDNDYSDLSVGGKFCTLYSSPVILTDTPQFSAHSSTITSDKGVFFYNELTKSSDNIGDLTFTGCTSSTSIFIAKGTQTISMEGNSFSGSAAINGMIYAKSLSSITIHSMAVSTSLPFSLYIESIPLATLSDIQFSNNSVNLFDTFVKSVSTDYPTFLISSAPSIQLYRSSGTLIDSSFVNITASRGGAAFLRESFLVATSINAENLKALSSASVFYLTDESNLIVKTSTLLSSSSVNYGGCLFIQNSAISFTSSTITSCSSAKSAGVARIEQGVLDLTKTNILTSSATLEASVFYAIRSTVSIINSLLANNTANASTILASHTTLIIFNTEFSNNTSVRQSKNIYLTQSTLSLSQSKFTDYQPANQISGAFLQIFKSEANIMTTTFLNGRGVYGGAAMVEAFSSVTFDSCIFSNNTAEASGGAIASSSYLEVLKSNFTKNSAASQGNEIFFKGADDLFMQDLTIAASLGSSSIYAQARKLSVILVNITGDYSLRTNSIIESRGITAFQTSEVIVTGSTFSNLFGVKGAGLHVINFSNKSVLKTTISQSSFVRNTAQRGAGFFIEGLTSSQIIDSSFVNNQAVFYNDLIGTGTGAGAYYSCSLSFTGCSFLVTRSTFTNNQAEMEGGGIKFDAASVVVDSSTVFTSNYAIYGPDIASYPIHLSRKTDAYDEVIKDFKNPEAFEAGFGELAKDSYEFSDMASGQNFGLFYALTDHYGNVVKTANTSYARFSTEDNTVYLENNERVSISGYFNFTGFVITIEPGVHLDMTLSTDAIPSEWINLATSSLASRRVLSQNTLNKYRMLASKGSLPISIQFRKCKLGEIQETNRCVPCADYKFSNDVDVSEESGTCRDCLTNAKCQGKNEMAPVSGYWRLTQISENILQCSTPEACLGGFDNDSKLVSYTGQCSLGYQGILCMECIENYARYGTSECVECVDNVLYDLRAIATIIVTIVMLVLGVKNQVQKKEIETAHTISMMKIYSNFSQTISIITLFSLSWPSSVSEVNSINNNYLSAPLQVFSMDCYYRGFGVSTTLVRTFMEIITPIILMILSTAFYFIYYSIKEGFKLLNDPENYAILRDAVIVTQLVIVFLFHPKIVSSAFSLFQCSNLGDTNHPEMYSTLEPQLKCFEGQHLNWVKYLGVPSIILWVVFVPMLMTLALWRYRAIIDRPDVMATYGFLTKGYRSEFFYWEMVIMYRKSILVIASIFMKIDPFLSGLNVLLYLFFWYILQLRIQPYLTHGLNQVEEYSLLTQFFYIYFSLYFVESSTDNVLKSVMVALLIIVYVGFHFYFVFVYAKEKVLELTETVSKMSEEMKHPILAQIFGRLSEMKLFSCVAVWLREQKEIVEKAIKAKEDAINAKLEKEIELHHSQKLIKEEIKQSVSEILQLKRTRTEDEFLSIKKKNKDMIQAAQKFANVFKSKQPPTVTAVNDRIRNLAFGVKNKRKDPEQQEQQLQFKQNDSPYKALDSEAIPLKDDSPASLLQIDNQINSEPSLNEF